MLFLPSISVRGVLMILIAATLACGSVLPTPPADEPVVLPPTRTPLPTFTPAGVEAAQVTVVIPPTATPLPPTPEPTLTNTPEPLPTEPPPTEEPTPEPTATDIPPPTAPPPPPPTNPPPPPPTEPPPPAGPVAGAHGVIGQLSFRDGRNTYGVGEKVFVKIEATNTTGGMLPFGILGLNTSDGNFQTSWDNSNIGAGETFRHEDGVSFGGPGNHKIWLSICFSTKDVCQSADGDWERFEPGVDVVIQ